MTLTRLLLFIRLLTTLEHLAMMEIVVGKMLDLYARPGSRTKSEFFKEGDQLDWPKAKVLRQKERATRSLQVGLTLFKFASGGRYDTRSN